MTLPATPQENMNGLRIGITIGLHQEGESVWNNGIKQNALFLAETLRHCHGVADVLLVNTTSVPITRELPWNLDRWPTISFEQAKDAVDILVELGGQIDAEQTSYLKQRGVRLVSYCCGFEYVHAMESILFGKTLWGDRLFVNQRYDDIWIIPQVSAISKPYFEVLRRKPATIVPFVWSPEFLEARTRDLPGHGVYRVRGRKAKRLSVMEPNINVSKFCLYPVMIAELVFRQRPQDIEILQVTNAERIARESTEFISLMNHLDIVRQHKAVFLGRHDTPTFLATHTDIVLSHQWENPLNYFYLEACWQGYPLVHNASLCQDLGYYYKGNDLAAGVDCVLHAVDAHDLDFEPYLARQRRQIDRYLCTNRAVLDRYSGLIADLMRKPIC